MRREQNRDLAGGILPWLAEVFPGHLSGETIAGRMNVSRGAVWKSIQRLKAKGLLVHGSRKGYRLDCLPDLLWPEYLEWLLQKGFLAKPSIVYREETESTNTLAKQLANQGAREGTLVVSDYQGGGRGRMGRSWFALPGKSLLFSIVLRPTVEPDQAASLSLVVALALSISLEQRGLFPQLKWPNDVLVDQKKVAGILLEAAFEPCRVQWIVAGVGVNVNYQADEWPRELARKATSLQEATGEGLNRPDLLRVFLETLSRLYVQWSSAGFSSSCRQAYLERMAWVGRPVDVRIGQHVRRGVALGVDEKGALLLRTGKTVERVKWGEGSLVVDRKEHLS